MDKQFAKIEDLKGATLVNVYKALNGIEDEIIFETSEGETFRMYHYQECCESVVVESIVGDLDDLVGHPLLQAEEVCSEPAMEEGDSTTWTFYKLGTIKGRVTIRWLGTSNGYYSESVTFEKIKK